MYFRYIPVQCVIYTSVKCYMYSQATACLGLDLSFFILNDRLCSKENCFYITEQSLYPGMRIAVTGFPSALGEGPEPLGNAPKLMTGRVTAGGAIQNIAESDITSTQPTMSGGALSSWHTPRHVLA